MGSAELGREEPTAQPGAALYAIDGGLATSEGIPIAVSTIPTAEEMFDARDQGLVLVREVSTDVGEALAEGTVAWINDEAHRMRQAGHLGTEEGRRGLRERSFADDNGRDEKRHTFKGKYMQGQPKWSPTIAPRLINVEYGDVGVAL